MSDELDKNISNKQEAVRSDAFLAKKSFDSEKGAFDQYSSSDFDDEYVPEINDLRHEIKLMMTLMSESKFDDIVHLISNPSRLMGINFIIGFVRGLGFALAILIMILIVLVSLSDTVLFSG